MDAVIDVSHHNGANLQFASAAAAGIMAAIQKATQGTTGVDPTFQGNRTAIKSANLLFGSYHFGDGSDGGAQAQHFLSVANPQGNELIALDLEGNPSGPSMTLEEARAFVTSIHSSIGKWPVLYSGHDLKELLGGQADAVLSNCPLWIAQYGPVAVLPPGWSAWSLWQYTDGMIPNPTSVNGIGHCDRSRFNGNTQGLSAFWASVSP
jgi:lysozyme